MMWKDTIIVQIESVLGGRYATKSFAFNVEALKSETFELDSLNRYVGVCIIENRGTKYD